MATLTICSSSSSSSCTTSSSTLLPFPPTPHTKSAELNHLHFSRKIKFSISRRHLPLLLSTCVFAPSLPAFAFDLGISGPKDWLKEQKKKSLKYLLAPIDASLHILEYAHQLLLAKDSDDKKKDLEQIQGLLSSASRDCIPEERNSVVTFQSKTGVEVCTFKLVVNNASSLLDDNDPNKMKAEAMLGDLIRSFGVLNGVAKGANIQLVSDREMIVEALMDTISSLHTFDKGIRGCVDV